MSSKHLSSKAEVMTYGYTGVEQNIFNYKWTIQNFEYCLSKYPLTSPDYFGRKKNILWYLEFEAITERKVQYITLNIGIHDKRSPVSAKFKVLILKNNGEKKNICEKPQEFDLRNFGPKESIEIMKCNYDEFCKEEQGNLPYGTLTLFCEVTVMDIVKKSGQFYPVKAHECCLSKDLENLFEIQKFCDIKFLVGVREFHAHKNILSVRSTVFSAMFDHEFAESKQNCITITDVDPDVFEEILRFMYTGQTKKIESMADALFIAADKYALERLKVMCEEVLSHTISIDNVCDFLVLADRHSADQLKDKTMKFIINNIDNVKSTVGWKNAKDSDPLVLVAIFESFKEISLG